MVRAARRIATGLALPFLGLVLGFLLLEGATRALHLWPDGFFQPNRFFGSSHIPDADGWWVNIDSPLEFQTHIKINSKGLRDREYAYEKDHGVFRILVLGDSFADAFEVPLENSFQEVLEGLLNEREGNTKFEVINGGHMAYGTDNELLFFRHEGYKYEPDIVLLAFLPANDVMDNSYELQKMDQEEPTKPFFVLRNGELQLRNFPYEAVGVQEQERKGILGSIKAWFHRHSRLYNFVGYTLKMRLPAVAEVLRAIELMSPLESGKQPDIPLVNFVYASQYRPEWEEAWAVTKALISQLDREVEDHNAHLVVVIVSGPRETEDCWPRVLEIYPAMREIEWDWSKPDRLLVGFLQTQGIPYLRLQPDFREYYAETGNRLHYQQDGHWNSEGHYLAAQLIYDYLAENKLVPVK